MMKIVDRKLAKEIELVKEVEVFESRINQETFLNQCQKSTD